MHQKSHNKYYSVEEKERDSFSSNLIYRNFIGTKGFIFIPDISGFTHFVNSIKRNGQICTGAYTSEID